MTIDTKPKSRAMLLAKAARMAGFDAAAGWPAELCDVSLSCLLAEVEACQPGNDAGLWLDMIDTAIKSGALIAARFERADDDLVISTRSGWHYLTRVDVADWLRNTGETPGELARAWFGDLWQTSSAADNSESPQQRRERLQKRCNELKAQGVRAWQKQTATEEKITVSRLKVILTETIKPKEKKGGGFSALAAFRRGNQKATLLGK